MRQESYRHYRIMSATIHSDSGETRVRTYPTTITCRGVFACSIFANKSKRFDKVWITMKQNKDDKGSGKEGRGQQIKIQNLGEKFGGPRLRANLGRTISVDE